MHTRQGELHEALWFHMSGCDHAHCLPLNVLTFTAPYPGVLFPSDSVVKNLPANVGDTGSILGSGRSPGEEMTIRSSIFACEIP